jgi:hypothetical protein
MPSWAEARLALQGLARLLRFDRDFVRFFDRSRAGALRSFWLAPIIYPYSILSSWIVLHGQAPNQASLLAALSVAYALVWIAMPLLLLALSAVLQREEEVVGSITIYNWASLLWLAIGLPLLLLDLASVSAETSLYLDYLYILVTAVIEWFMLRHALRVSGVIAAGLTFADLLMTHFMIMPMLLSRVMAS